MPCLVTAVYIFIAFHPQCFDVPGHLAVISLPQMAQGWVQNTEVGARRLVQFLSLLLLCWILGKFFAVPQPFCSKQIIMFTTAVQCFDFYR